MVDHRFNILASLMCKRDGMIWLKGSRSFLLAIDRGFHRIKVS
jgi:hypothetical protein